MYIGHGCLCVCACLFVCPSPHSYATAEDPNVTLENARQCSLVVHYLADLQSVHRLLLWQHTCLMWNVSECSCTHCMASYIIVVSWPSNTCQHCIRKAEPTIKQSTLLTAVFIYQRFLILFRLPVYAVPCKFSVAKHYVCMITVHTFD